MYADAYTDEYGNPIDPNVTSGVAPFSAGLSQAPAAGSITNVGVSQPNPVPLTPQQLGGGYNGAKDLTSLIRYWKQSHPATSAIDMPGLIAFLNQNGIAASNATHNGMQSDDKILLNGQTYDLGSSFGSPQGAWFDNFEPQGQDTPTPIDPSYLAPFSEAFSQGGAAAQPSYTPPPAFSYGEFQAPTGDSILQDPSYQFRLDQGAKALEASAAGRGVLNTGGTLKDLLGYGQNFASQEYGNIYGRNLDAWKANQNNALQSYATNYGVGRDTYNALVDSSNEAYNRAWNQYLDRKNTFYANEDRPFNKLYSLANTGVDVNK